jgi:hypothetical protein
VILIFWTIDLVFWRENCENDLLPLSPDTALTGGQGGMMLWYRVGDSVIQGIYGLGIRREFT